MATREEASGRLADSIGLLVCANTLPVSQEQGRHLRITNVSARPQNRHLILDRYGDFISGYSFDSYRNVAYQRIARSSSPALTNHNQPPHFSRGLARANRRSIVRR